jgi:hypothetical protein
MSLASNPEAIYGDAVAKIRAYQSQSMRLAQEGDAHGAVHAAWAADISTVQAIVWERIMVASARPDQQFFAVATTVSRALSLYASRPVPTSNARDAVEQARAGLAAAFDDNLLKLVTERYITLDHLDGLPYPTVAAASAARHARTNGQPIEVYIAGKREEAADAMSVAKGMRQEGRTNDAVGQAYQSDLAALEAYLVDCARAVGDPYLATADLRWSAACDAIASLRGLPADFEGAVETIRATILRSLGPIDASRMVGEFQPF